MKSICQTLALVALAATMAACSNTSQNQSAQASPAASNAAEAGAASASALGSQITAYDPCAKLTKADVAPYFKVPIAAVLKQDLAGSAAGCSYDTAGGRSTIDVSIVTGPQAQQFYNSSTSNGGKPGTPLAGVGDKAARTGGDVWVTAMKGDVFCSVSGKHGSPGARGTGEIVGLEQYDTNDDIPNAVAQPVALRLAALCQKLFAL